MCDVQKTGHPGFVFPTRWSPEFRIPESGTSILPLLQSLGAKRIPEGGHRWGWPCRSPGASFGSGHALFDIEDFHGLHPVEIGGKYYLEFSGPTLLNPHGIYEHEQDNFLRVWLKERKKWLPERRDTEEEKKEKQKQYDLWRYEYPRNVARETSDRIRLRAKKEKLEKELQAIREELGEWCRVPDRNMGVTARCHIMYPTGAGSKICIL